ncbi:FadR/GntR family transcriptional regulator [Caenimonas terrae]|uniref:FadR/GntR family transcriptional regulator n=1 Tax=Caenimonas terrae TaxID=696074 RepID=A0ABW0NKH3_9BURK
MPLQSVEPQRLYRQIAEQLRSLIASGEFQPGSRLPAERDLARQLGVSRPTVREALIALEVEDVVDVRTGSGIYVVQPATRAGKARAAAARDLAEWGPLELMRARELVEGEVAALAARNAKKSQVAAIAQALAQMQDQAGAGLAPRAGDEAFHTAVALACGNEVLRDTVHGYWRARSGALFERLGDHFENPASWKAALGEHTAVLEAIRAHDAGAARSAMQSHLKKAYTRYSASWRRANSS